MSVSRLVTSNSVDHYCGWLALEVELACELLRDEREFRSRVDEQTYRKRVEVSLNMSDGGAKERCYVASVGMRRAVC